MLYYMQVMVAGSGVWAPMRNTPSNRANVGLTAIELHRVTSVGQLHP